MQGCPRRQTGVEVLKGQATLEDIVDDLFDAGLEEAPPLDVLLDNTSNLQRERIDSFSVSSLLFAKMISARRESRHWGSGAHAGTSKCP